MTGDLDVIIRKLAELEIVHADLLLLGRSTEGEAGHEVHEEEDEAGEDKGPEEGGAGAGELVADLNPVVLDPADGVLLVTRETSDPGTGISLVSLLC